jgi:hypothetical protein
MLDVAQPDLDEGITVRHATRRGRDAADDLIREIVAEVPDATAATSDRALRRDVKDAVATVIGSGQIPRPALLCRLLSSTRTSSPQPQPPDNRARQR